MRTSLNVTGASTVKIFIVIFIIIFGNNLMTKLRINLLRDITLAEKRRYCNLLLKVNSQKYNTNYSLLTDVGLMSSV